MLFIILNFPYVSHPLGTDQRLLIRRVRHRIDLNPLTQCLTESASSLTFYIVLTHSLT